jgi:hypothetical protein
MPNINATEFQLKVVGEKKALVYLRLFNSFLTKLFIQVPARRRNILVKRFQSIDQLFEVKQCPAVRASGAIVFRIEPSKHLLKFAAAIGAGHLNRRWKN